MDTKIEKVEKTITFAPYIDKDTQYKILETMLHFHKEKVDNLSLIARLNGQLLSFASTENQIKFI